MRGVRVAGPWLVAALLAAPGCVHREIEILSRPPGARIEFDGRLMSEPTPVRFPFTWYGTHEVIIEKPGYHRERLVTTVLPPWYEQFPIDFFSEFLWPQRLFYIKTYPFVLEKEVPMDNLPEDEKAAMKGGLIERAERFRRMAWQEVGKPPAETPPAPAKAPAEKKEETEKK